MRKLCGIGLALALTIAVSASASGEQATGICLLATPVVDCPPKLEVDLDASISPRKLPKHELAPVAMTLEGSVSHDDGSQPSALREVVLDVDRDLELNASGVPACRVPLRAIRSSRRACPRSVVGEGRARIALAFATEPVAVDVVVLNGGVSDGKRVVYLHSLPRAPVPMPFVATVKINRDGHGLHTVTEIPSIAGGEGSILTFRFTIRRLLTNRAQKTGYLEAKCPDDVFHIDLPKILLMNDARTPGTASSTVFRGALRVPCLPLLRGRRSSHGHDDVVRRKRSEQGNPL